MNREYLGTSLPDLWEQGAQELEKSTLGKIITAPVRITVGAINAAEGTIGAIPGIVKTVPFILLLLAGGIALYLYQSGKKGTKLLGHCK